MQPKRKDAIEGLKDSLYSRTKEPKLDAEARVPLYLEDTEPLAGAWSDSKLDMAARTPLQEPIRKKHMSFAFKFFIVAAIFFVGASSLAAYLFFVKGTTISPQNIDLQIVAPSIIDGGKNISFEVIVANRNQSPLQLVDMSIQYPPGTRDPADQSKTITYDKQSIGSIAAGEQVKRTSNAVLYGQEGSEQKVAVVLSYSVPGSNSVYQKQAEASFTIGSSPVSVQVAAPAEAIAGQQFQMDITVTSNSPTPIQNLVLQGQYPFGFSVVGTNPTADTGGTVWRLGTLNPGVSKIVHLTGTIDGQDGDERIFRFQTGAIADQTDTQIKVPFITVPQSLTVHRPFVSASITLNGKSGKTISITGQTAVSGKVTWQNNLSTPVSNLQLVLTLSGPVLDTTSISSPNGFYQSANSTLTWTKDQDPSLALILPGASGELPFSFSTLAPGTSGTVYTNPTVSLNVGVTGQRQGQSGVPEVVSSAATLQASIASDVVLMSEALHFSGPFTNSGPMPPIAEQPTTYTIVWTTRNPSNTIANTLVSAVLPTYVDFIAGQAGSAITYDRPSRTVSWSIGDLKAGTGFSLASKSAAFQVVLHPSTTQVGQIPLLTGEAKLVGQDRFAQVQVGATASAPSTLLSGDAQFLRGMEIVAASQ